jgi:hypothetical protein
MPDGEYTRIDEVVVAIENTVRFNETKKASSYHLTSPKRTHKSVVLSYFLNFL